MTPRDLFLQFLARHDAPTHGKDGTLHFGNVPRRALIGPISHLGTLIPVMAGAALAARMRGQDRVALTYIGDGGTSTGDFHEGLNLAAVLKIPLVLVVENNGYAYSTPTERQFRVLSLAEHDDMRYVPVGLLEAWKDRDPIGRFAAFLAEEGHATRAALAAVADELAAPLEEAAREAQDSPHPPPEETLRGVYREAGYEEPWWPAR